MLTVEEITEANKLHELKDDWARILEISKRHNLFLTYEWITIWLRHFWKDKPILFLVIKSDQRPIGLAPLLVNEEKKIFMLPVNAYSYRQDFILGGNYEQLLEVLFCHLRTRIRRVKSHFREIEINSSTAKTFPGISRRCGIIVVFKEVAGSPFLSIAGDWPTFLKSKSKHFRDEQKRKMNKLRKAGQIDFVKITSPYQVPEAMRDILIIERKSWKEQEGSSFTAVPGLQEFYLEVAETFAKKDCLCTYLLYINSVPVAHLFGIAYENRYYALKTSYDESYRELSPGAVLFSHALQDAFQSSLKEFDFLGVESRWKNEIATDKRNLVDIFIYPRSIPYHLVGYLENTVKPLVKKRVPFIVDLKRRFRRSSHHINAADKTPSPTS